MSTTSLKNNLWLEAELLHLSQMQIVTPLLAMPPTGLISLRYVWKASDPAGGEYQVLQGHHPIFNSVDIEKAVEVFIDPKEYIQE